MITSLLVGVLAAICLQDPIPENTSVDSGSKPATTSKVLLEFREQEWLPALQWLAERLELNLDWQELPSDSVSLSSTQPISLEEAEDLFNMQLLARGFAMVKRAGVLRVVSLKDLDVTLVPRVEPEELMQLPKHSVVRVSFPLDWMIADEAAKELEPLLSPYGKLFPMASANRLEAIDAVVNLREFHRLLTQAETDDTRKERVAEFHLQHRRAEELAPKIRQLLGLPPDGTASSSVQTQLDIEQARFKAEAVKQMGRDAQTLLTDKKPTIFLVVNEKENSLLVNAPPNKIEIVRQAVDAMDKKVPDRNSTWETLSRVKVYDVSGFDPDAVTKMITSLQERDSIGKDARVQHEAAYNRLIAYASPADHLTISQVIDSFRAERRSATVLSLANLDPIYATKAIQLVLKASERPSRAPGVPSDGKFQIEADAEHSRLLLWATPNEVKDVREFLSQLGETFSERAAGSNVQVIETHGQDVGPLVERLKRVWSDLSDSPLIYEQETAPKSAPAPGVPADPVSVREDGVQLASGLMIAAKGSGSPPELPAALERPPVRVMQAADGSLVVLSKDSVAADTVKRLIQQLIKRPTQLKTIELKYAQAATVKRQLDILFPSTTSTLNKLAATPTLLIDVDSRTNRLIIQNASERQLEQIDESIALLDQPSSEDEKLQREKVTYRLKHRKASIVAEALKSIYQDLMSVNDRVLTRSTGFSKSLAATSTNPEYQGLLSIGVDAEANLLLISAPKYLVQDVLQVVETMDTPTDGNSIAIVPFQVQVTGTDSKDQKMQDALRRILGEKRR